MTNVFLLLIAIYVFIVISLFSVILIQTKVHKNVINRAVDDAMKELDDE